MKAKVTIPVEFDIDNLGFITWKGAEKFTDEQNQAIKEYLEDNHIEVYQAIRGKKELILNQN